MKKILIALAVLAAVGAGVRMYSAVSASDLDQMRANQLFVQFTENDPDLFFREVENAVGACTKIDNLPDDLSQRVRTISSKIVAKIMYLRANRKADEDLKTAINLWLKEQLEPQIKRLPNNQFDMLVKEIGAIIASPDTIKCIVVTSVAKHDQSQI